jgi:hypothetical protein
MKTIRNITYPAFALFAFVCFALSPQARATCQDGCDNLFINTFLGEDVLINNTTGTGNTGIGYKALEFNTVGFDNTATGVAALVSNTSGYYNTATGYSALVFNTTGNNNTANGRTALYNNTTGSANTATGVNALYFNTIGYSNTATGLNALGYNSEGYYNTAIGLSALFSNTTGHDNIALGFEAGLNLTTGSNNIDIGNAGVAGDSNTIRIGTTGTQTATFVAGIRGVAITGGQQVGVSGSGQLGIRASSARFKKNIKPIGRESEAILSLRPVSFRYKKELDPSGDAQFGLVAEDVAKVAPELVVCDEQGKPLSVRYEEINAMLLNEFLKEHRKVESLENAMAEQQKENAAMRAMLSEQAAQIQKVSAQLELSKSAPQTVQNNR